MHEEARDDVRAPCRREALPHLHVEAGRPAQVHERVRKCGVGLGARLVAAHRGADVGERQRHEPPAGEAALDAGDRQAEHGLAARRRLRTAR